MAICIALSFFLCMFESYMPMTDCVKGAIDEQLMIGQISSVELKFSRRLQTSPL